MNNTISLNIINPKAKKLINSLADLGLVEIQKNSLFELEDAFVKKLDKEYEKFINKKGKFYTMDEVFSNYKK